MRMVAHGAEITTAVVEVVDTLQNEREVGMTYLATLDELCREIIVDDNENMGRLRVLQMLRRDLAALIAPPDLDKEENDIPIIEV